MSSFTSSTYSHSSYYSTRTRYSEELYSYIVAHCANKNHALDIGCGPGMNTVPLLKYFDKVTGTDTSPGMIDEANKHFSDEPRLDFYQSTDKNFAELIPEESIDLITVAQAIHWFDIEAFYENVYKALKPNGVLAFWGYVDPFFVGYTEASELFLKYFYDSKYLGPYWEQPGRTRLRQKLVFANPSSDRFKTISRLENLSTDGLEPDSPIEFGQSMTLKQFNALAKTASSYHAWKSENPNAPDIIDQFADEVKSLQSWTDDTELTIKWYTMLVLVSKN